MGLICIGYFSKFEKYFNLCVYREDDMYIESIVLYVVLLINKPTIIFYSFFCSYLFWIIFKKAVTNIKCDFVKFNIHQRQTLNAKTVEVDTKLINVKTIPLNKKKKIQIKF